MISKGPVAGRGAPLPPQEGFVTRLGPEKVLLELDFVATERRFAAVVHDQASALALLNILEQVRQKRWISYEHDHRADESSTKVWYAAIALTIASLLLLLITLMYLVADKAGQRRYASNTFYFDIGRSNKDSLPPQETRRSASPTSPAAKPAASDLTVVHLIKRTDVNYTIAAATPEKPKGAAKRESEPGQATQQAVRASSIEPTAADLTGNDPTFDKAHATKEAFDTGRIQEWTEDGQTGFVIADPPIQGANSSCRTMILWRTGAAQGEVTKSSLCRPIETQTALRRQRN